MIVHVYEVTKCYVVDVPLTDKEAALREAVAMVKRGEVSTTPIDYAHIATLANTSTRPFDPRAILRSLLALPPEKMAVIAARIGKHEDAPPTKDQMANWVVELLTHARNTGQMSQLAAALHELREKR